ncbi:MAG: hypothetical protein FJ276_31135 [Planctomycetes bacterium]|nr:hypothetical protein [Planctomycetota bacterium]
MSKATFFIRACPTCGRRLQIRVEYLGRILKCRHCDASFEASDPSLGNAPPNAEKSLLDRANQLLESIDATRNKPR